MDRAELERLDRESLVLRAQAAGIKRARILTRPELVDELLRLDPSIDPEKLKRSRGFFGRARDLLNKVVERGLHLPDAAERLVSALGTTLPEIKRPEPQAIPTVTLAEIYAAQGHKQRAIETLKRVLDREPEHVAARALLDRLEAADYVAPPPPLPPEPEIEREVADEPPADEPQPITQDRPVEIVAPPPSSSNSIEDEVTITLPRKRHVAIPREEPPEEITVAIPGDKLPPFPLPPIQPPPKSKPAVVEPAAVAPVKPQNEEDVCVAMPLDRKGAMFVVWRLSESSKQSIAEGAFVVRAVIVTPSWDGPRRDTRDFTTAVADGERTIDGLPEGAIVRVAIGTKRSGDFLPIAHSPAFERRDNRVVLWSVGGVRPVSGRGDELGTPAIARAFEHAISKTAAPSARG